MNLATLRTRIVIRGDRIVVVSGSYFGARGRVEAVREDGIAVRIDGQSWNTVFLPGSLVVEGNGGCPDVEGQG